MTSDQMQAVENIRNAYEVETRKWRWSEEEDEEDDDEKNED